MDDKLGDNVFQLMSLYRMLKLPSRIILDIIIAMKKIK